MLQAGVWGGRRGGFDTDAYVPLAQTSITSAYANGAQATYGHR